MLGKTNGNDVADGQLALVEHQLGLPRRCIAAPVPLFFCFSDISLCNVRRGKMTGQKLYLI